ncbi:MAG: hypothetical protein QOG68_2633 [Solirubrobacteraceae bacterium]|jgi:hypothetical protein|nr:hypothetical protein [Solirubrobacteraceae bacterium]
MAVCVIMDFAGGSAEQYDRVVEKMDLGDHVPERAIFHAAGGYGDGWRVVDVWESPEAFQQFAAEKIGPIAGAEGLPEPQVEMFDVDELTDERGGDTGGISFLQVVRLDGLDEATFKANDAKIRDEGQTPDGGKFHVNGQGPNGWMVADGWTSKEARDTFVANKVMPVMQDSGAPPPTIEDLPVHNTLAAR